AMSADTAPHPILEKPQTPSSPVVPAVSAGTEAELPQMAHVPGDATKGDGDKSNELYILSIDEIKSGNLIKILEDKRRSGYTIDNNTRLLMMRDIMNYYMRLPMEELQLKVREMELRFRNRPKQ
ncbi:MAG: hypothetical protein HGB11_03175, partial [Chlorobiales bacterium]|nr:hypothetical protein [Chlorobiales bacterium]